MVVGVGCAVSGCAIQSCEMQVGCFLLFEVSKILRTVRPLRLMNHFRFDGVSRARRNSCVKGCNGVKVCVGGC